MAVAALGAVHVDQAAAVAVGSALLDVRTLHIDNSVM
jgi:hypothetical protein